MTGNRFAGATGIEELIGLTVGAGSSPRLWMSERMSDAEPLPATCDTLGRPCIFDSRAASAIVSEAVERLSQLLGNGQDDEYPITSHEQLSPYCIPGTIVESSTGRGWVFRRWFVQIFGPAVDEGEMFVDMPLRVLRSGVIA